MKFPAILFAMLLAVSVATALTINEPSGEYSGIVRVNLTTNETVENLSYSLLEDSAWDACTNCSELIDNLNLSAGNYTIVAVATNGNSTTSVNGTFSVVNLPLPEVNDTNETNQTPSVLTNFTLAVTAPIATTYNSTTVPLVVSANETLDSLSYSLDNASSTQLCTNCSQANATLNASEGNHTLTVEGVLGNLTKNVVVSFTVSLPATSGNETNTTNNQTNQTGTNSTNGNQTNGNQTNTNQTSGNQSEPRYTVGLNKLPQMLEAGELTDSELAEIIRNNKLNPGVINRLSKSGLLGNESLQAIIETQSTPPGIWRKLAGFFGVHIPTAKESLIENYELTEEQLEAIEAAPDVTEKGAAKAAAKAQTKQTPPGLAKKQAPAQADDDESDDSQQETQTGKPTTPPGLAKKDAASAASESADADDAKANGKDNGKANAPGQQKKNN